MGCHFLLQRIFLIQGSKLGFPHCRWVLYHLSHQGSPSWVWVVHKSSECPYRRQKRTHREGHEMVEAEIRVIMAQDHQGFLGSPGPRKGAGDPFFPRATRRNQPVHTGSLDFCPQSCGKIYLCCMKPPSWWPFVMAAPGVLSIHVTSESRISSPWEGGPDINLRSYSLTG